MKISAIKAQVKNPNRVSVFVDGKYSFSLTLDQLLSEKLKKDSELSEADIKKLKKLSDEGKIKQRALEWLLNRPHSTKEFKDYMYRKKSEKDFTDALVEEFSEKNYLDDKNFCRWFMENRMRKNKSMRAIESELRSKGVPYETIKSIATEMQSSESEKESLEALVNKLRKKPRYSDDVKLKQYLLSKGFNYSDIKDAVD